MLLTESGRGKGPTLDRLLLYPTRQTLELCLDETYQFGAGMLTEIMLLGGICLQIETTPVCVPLSSLNFLPSLQRAPILKGTRPHTRAIR